MKSTGRLRRRLALALAVVLVTPGIFASTATAHGPVAPVATSYLAKVSGAPTGLEAKVFDGDQRLWLRVRPGDTVVVRDYRGGAYLRFSPAGVEVNRSSAMYYLNQTPAQLPPSAVSPVAAPRWQRVAGSHEYSWHDGRLHALAVIALAPGSSFVGHWRIPVVVDGRSAAIFGGVWHAANPSIVWFWPIVVLLACVLAAVRLHRPANNARISRALAVATLPAIATAAAGRELYGRPDVSAAQLVLLGIVLAFVAYGLGCHLIGREGPVLLVAVSVVSLWLGATLVPVLLQGFVLMVVPAVVARVADVLCLAGGGSLFVMLLAGFGLEEAEGARAGESH